jgi:hypothetical protein
MRTENVAIQLTHHGVVVDVDKKRTESIHNTICIGVPIIRKSLVCQIEKNNSVSRLLDEWSEAEGTYSLPCIHQDHRLTSLFCAKKCEVVRNIATPTRGKISHSTYV